MKSILCGLALIGVFSAAGLSSANLHEEHPALLRSVSIDSAAVLTDVGVHSQGGGEAASALEMDAVQTNTHKAKRTKAVTWINCVAGECHCGEPVAGRDVVIRYHREHGAAPDNAVKANVMFNWHWHQQNLGRTVDLDKTPRADTHMKGFLTGANELQACGGITDFAKDCNREPETCAFDIGNTYDAKAGEYCCNADMGYCSYKCKGNEVFACPSLTAEKNFPGGLDPAGPDVMKRCYMAQYPSSSNPEVAEDSEVEDTIQLATGASGGDWSNHVNKSHGGSVPTAEEGGDSAGGSSM